MCLMDYRLIIHRVRVRVRVRVGLGLGLGVGLGLWAMARSLLPKLYLSMAISGHISNRSLATFPFAKPLLLWQVASPDKCLSIKPIRVLLSVILYELRSLKIWTLSLTNYWKEAEGFRVRSSNPLICSRILCLSAIKTCDRMIFINVYVVISRW